MQHIPTRIVTEIHRYSKPEDAFGFHKLEMDDSINGWVELFGITYRETGSDLWGRKNAESQRELLREQGFKPLRLSELDEDHRRFVIFNQAPLEWHKGLDENEDALTKRVIVWVI